MNELVALDLPPSKAFVDTMRKCWDDGDAIVPIDPRLPTPARAQLLDALRPLHIVDATGRSSLPNSVPMIAGDAVVIATSGTTGTPKGVVLTHAALAASALATSKRLGIVPASDKWFSCLPLAHIGGLSVITRALITGTPFTVLPSFDVDAVNAATDTGHTRVSLVVSAFARINPLDWKTVLLGGSAIPAVLPDNVVRTYGMTETGSGVVYNGVPLDGVEIASRDNELFVRGPMLFRSYRQPLANGDAGTIDEQGVVSVVGRIGDVIVTGGEKVWPDAVEQVLKDHQDVLEVAVLGVEDSAWGQRVVAVVVPRDLANPPSLDSLRAHTKITFPAYAAPRQLVIRASLPRTSSGKVQRRTLANDLATNDPAANVSKLRN
jgi:o-succinylbenzoate---CoA ligase